MNEIILGLVIWLSLALPVEPVCTVQVTLDNDNHNVVVERNFTYNHTYYIEKN